MAVLSIKKVAALMKQIAINQFFRFSSNVSHPNSTTIVLDLLNNKHIGLRACLKGWVKAIRKMKRSVFINVNDGSCSHSIQIVIPKGLSPEGLTYGSSVNVTGIVQTDPRGNIEIVAENINVLGKFDVTKGYPFTPWQNQSFDYYRQYLHHRPKLLFFSSLFRIRHAAVCEIHNYFTDNKFVGIHTPLLTSNDCEGAGETFNVQPSSDDLLRIMQKDKQPKEETFFNCKTYLTVSGQFHLEVITRSLPKVYSFNPTFRAENSKSRLHLSEFYMVEVEEAFVNSLTDILRTIEDFVKRILFNLITKYEKDFNYILQNNSENQNEVYKDHLSTLDNLLQKPFTVMTYSEAHNIITENMDSGICKTGFTKEQELFLVKHNGSIPIFVINWPKNLKPFYAKASSQNAEEVQAVDLLVPIVGELCGGSIREDDYDTLKDKLTEAKLLNQLYWYLEIRKYGNIPTGGFGMGFDRFLQLVLNITNIKDTIPFPRWPHNLQM